MFIKTRRPGLLLASVFLLAAGLSRPPASASMGTASGLDDIYGRGRKAFYRELRSGFGLHPRRFRLTFADAQKIERAESEIPRLYERVIRLTYSRKAPQFELLLGKGDPRSIEEFEALFLGLSREAAGLFIQSLFEEPNLEGWSPGALPDFKESRLELVLSSLSPEGKEPPWTGKEEWRIAGEGPSGFWGLKVIRAQAAKEVSRGAGVKVAVLDYGSAGAIRQGGSPPANPVLFAPLAGMACSALRDPTVPHGGSNPFGGNPSFLVKAVAPDSDVRVLEIHRDDVRVCPFWAAYQVSRGIHLAVDGGADVILVTAAFDRDFRFLKDACDYAYAHNILVVSPNCAGPPGHAAPEIPAHFPAHYNTTAAVGGVVLSPRGTPEAWAASEPSHYTTCAAPTATKGGPRAAASGLLSLGNAPAAALVAGTSALICSLLPKTGEELSGQYVQRVYEVLCRSCDGGAVGRPGFDPRTGYGLIDAERAVRQAVPAYKEKMAQVEASFKKRMEERTAKEREVKND